MILDAELALLAHVTGNFCLLFEVATEELDDSGRPCGQEYGVSQFCNNYLPKGLAVPFIMLCFVQYSL